MKLYDNILQLIGNTPLIKINRLNTGSALVYAKMECFNPLSSVKDRAALSIIESAEKEGKLKKGGTIIEATSGNTGIGLAAVAAVKGYKVLLTMPENMSLERRKLLSSLGAELVLTEASLGMKGAIEKAEELAAHNPGAFIASQFDNPANAEAHFNTTGPEIWQDTDGTIDIFVSAVGTGGTLTGTARYLKQKNPNIRIVAVEPELSAVLSGEKASPHKLQGIGAGFVPSILDVNLIDQIYKSNQDLAGETARQAAKQEGLFIGISSGAALEAALNLSKRSENIGKVIVVLLPDTGERYLSTWLFENIERNVYVN